MDGLCYGTTIATSRGLASLWMMPLHYHHTSRMSFGTTPLAMLKVRAMFTIRTIKDFGGIAVFLGL